MCSPKMPEEVVREDFMRGCLKVAAEAKVPCSCAWNALRSHLSPAEIAAADGPVLEMHKEKMTTACAKARPKS